MKHLINREDYIREYLRISEQIENKNELDEGLLGTLFGGLKMLLKRDWANIKCKNPSVLKHLQEIDKSLSGYTMTKMQFSNECQNIRQNVADYFNDILNYKLSQIEKVEDPNAFIENEDKEKEENKDGKGVAKSLNIKDKTLLDSIKKYKENIATACKPDAKLREYADQMLNSVEVFVNDVVLAELEKKGLDKEKAEAKRKKLEEYQKKLDDIRKKMDEEAKKADEDAMKKLEKERDDAFTKLGVKPIGPMDGDKAIDTISKEFKKVLSEFKDMTLNESASSDYYGDILDGDTYLGIKNSIEKIKWNEVNKDASDKTKPSADKFIIRVILSKINTVFNVISKDKLKPMFKDVPSASAQAMMVALSNAVIYGFMGGNFEIDDNILSLLTKCAIDSDATIGFNLPLIDASKPENGNFFVSIMNQFRNTDVSSKEIDGVVEATNNKEKKLILKAWKKYKKNGIDDDALAEFSDWGKNQMKVFKSNMATLFDDIVKKAKELKENAEKEREVAAAAANNE